MDIFDTMASGNVLDGATIASPGDRTIRIAINSKKLVLEDLQNHFSVCGDIHSAYWSQAKTYAFITFMNELSKDVALRKTHQIILGIEVKVLPAHLNNNRIFVNGFYIMAKEKLENHFKKFGEIMEIKSPKSLSNRYAKGYCFIRFASERAAFNALLKNVHGILGRNLKVVRARARIGKQKCDSPVVAISEASNANQSENENENSNTSASIKSNKSGLNISSFSFEFCDHSTSWDISFTSTNSTGSDDPYISASSIICEDTNAANE